MSVTTRGLCSLLLALALALLLAACGGGDGGARTAGRLTDPRSVPTATPWADPPEPIILEPGALTPIAEGMEDQEGTEGGEATFRITAADEMANLRASPTTDSDIVGRLNEGEEKTVVAQVSGQEVEEGNDIWYQLDDGSFVYSGAVNKIEE